MRYFTNPGDEERYTEALNQLYETAQDKKAYFHVGYFMMWYASVELRLTYLLARATDISDLEAFELLTYGLDVKGKIERFKKAAAGKIGPNLARRIDEFNGHIRPIRNKVAHLYPVPDSTQKYIGFASLTQFPKFSEIKPPKGKPAFQLSMLDFFEYPLLSSI